jgi:hypothetical protein
LILWLLGCTNPISNLAFYEDAAFAEALPSKERMGPPADVRIARVGTSIVLADAVAATANMGDFVETLVRSGEALRGAEPDGRGDVSRSWSAVQAAGDIGNERFVWWVRGELVRPSDAGDTTWTLELAGDEAGPWIPVGDGRHDPSGYGTAEWDIAAAAELLEPGQPANTLGILKLSYDDNAEGENVRQVAIDHRVGVDVVDSWVATSSVGLGWFGVSSLVDPPAPAVFQVFHTPDGGWAVGEVYADTGLLEQRTCWSPTGDTQYESGDIRSVATEAACSIAYPF